LVRIGLHIRPLMALGLALLTAAGCQRLPGFDPALAPDSEVGPAAPGGDSSAVDAMVATGTSGAADKLYCPDADRDDWSWSAGCNVADCNETRIFADPDSGWCPQVKDLICQPADLVSAGDFAMLRPDDGLLHVIYIEGPLWTIYPATHGKSFGHMTSPDGVTWQVLPDALTAAPAADWDRDHIWAPCVVRNPADGLYWMFYTGVTTNAATGWHEERIGAATSSNLVDWTRVTVGGCAGIIGPGCLMDADWGWTSWDDPNYWARACRDPFVIADPASGVWYMVYSTSPGPFRWQGIVGLARSNDLVHWEDRGPLAITAGQKAESPVLFRQGGRLHLIWTLGDDGGIGHSTATDFESGDWTAATVIAGSAAGLQVAPEVLDLGDWFLLGYVKETLRDLRFRSLRFFADGTVAELPIAPLDCVWIGAENVHPGALEIANGVDDNCNGLVDEPSGTCPDADGDQFGAPGSPYCSRLEPDCDDSDPDVNPNRPEICGNGRDDDCDGVIDDPERCGQRFPDRIRAIY